MIKLESVHIEEVRGIRKLDLDFQKEKFAISGPNGSGKSGVIDAIEFGLTGQIGRLAGRGTKGLSVCEHGPHVDKSKFPGASFVTLRVFLGEIGKSATITRLVSAPNKPNIEPPDDDVKAALAEIAEHPEITLSRREILRFILVEPTTRSEEIQTILKLDEIGQTRAALNTAQNRLQNIHKIATAQVQAGRSALQLHLQIATLRSEDLLEAVNRRRKVLDLSEIAELTADTKLDNGLSNTAQQSEFNKDSALRDLGALALAAGAFRDLGRKETQSIVADLKKLEDDPALHAALKQRAFVESGLAMVEGPACPLCDKPWDDEQHLRDHLTAKLSKSVEAQKLQDSLLENAVAITESIIGTLGLLTPVVKLAERQGEKSFAQILASWKRDLETLKIKLASVSGITPLKQRFMDDWLKVPERLSENLENLSEKVTAKSDQSRTMDAQSFLTAAQLRLGDYREAMRKSKAAAISWTSAKEAYATYCDVLETELNALYEEVQKDFSTFYRAINEGDESTFTAKLTPSAGSLSLDVNFYERGLFPPGAYTAKVIRTAWGFVFILHS